MTDPTVDSILSQWSPQRQERARAVLAAYPERRSTVMPLLYLASREHGHCSTEAMVEVGQITGLTSIQVESIASFYSMYRRQNVGTYVISVCTSISCFLRGADDVLAAIEDETNTPDGETSDDGLFSVEHVECSGACGGAPAVSVNWELVEGVAPDKGRALCQWLRDTKPETVLADEMQTLFGGQQSFDWGISEPQGATSHVPAFERYDSAGEAT
jgi:NADH:ubiquinone oxidoreductase subunit E